MFLLVYPFDIGPAPQDLNIESTTERGEVEK